MKLRYCLAKGNEMTTPIPQPPGVPLLGNIFDVDPNNTWNSLKKLADKYGAWEIGATLAFVAGILTVTPGPIFKIKALGHEIVFIASAALLEEICDESRFRKCVTGPIIEIRQAVHDSLFTAFHDEPSWGIAHRIMAPWAQRSNESMFNDMLDSLSVVSAHWTAKQGQRVDVSDALKRLSLQSVLFSFFHQKADFLTGPEPAMLAAIDRSTLEAVKRPTRPRLLNWLLYQRAYNRDIHTMRTFSADIVAKRRAEPAASTNDMLNALLHSKDPETGEALNETRVIDEIITLFIGAATTPCFLSFALFYLLQNPDTITKAREEIDTIIGESGPLTYTDLPRFHYCEAILREAMRLSAVAPGFNIEPRPDVNNGEPVTLGGGEYAIAHNQVMITILAAVNRDPTVFDDPEAFRPERMLGDAYDRLPSGVKKGFGNGKRECFGKLFAWQWSMITLITILRDVDLEMADPKYVLRTNGAFCVQPLGFHALVGPRKKVAP